jgi:hypothetical protein
MSKIPKNINPNPFRLPENYFEQLTEDIQTGISEEKLKEKFGKKKPFTVPENYFNTIDIQIPKKEYKISPKRKYLSVLKISVSAAAGLILIMTIKTLVFNSENIQPKTASVKTIQESPKLTPAEIELSEDVDETTIVSVINEPTNSTDTVSDQKYNDDIMNYLADNSEDLDLASN